MKALVFHGAHDIRYESVPDPVLPDARGAVVRVAAAGICGSDLHIYGGHGFSGGAGYCVGHEAVGEVVEVGSAVEHFAPGDRVFLAASVGCGRCAPCRQGALVRCENPSEAGCYGIGLPTLGGCQAEAVAVPAADFNLVAAPPELGNDAALVLTDNAPTAWFGARLGRVGPGDTVAVVGLGPVGLLAVKAALLMGAATVFAVDLVADRRRRAAAMGAVPIDGDAKSELRERTGGRGANVVIEAVGADATIDLALGLAAGGGRVSVVGVNQNMSFPFPMALAQLKCLEFAIGLCSVQYELPQLLPLTLGGRLRPEEVVTHHLPLSEGPDAYALFASRADGVGKVVLDVS
jgi:alcohol dehydrogenase